MSDENFPLSERPPREGEPWTPEENLLVLAEQPTPPAAFEAFEAIRQLRETAVNAVAAFHLSRMGQLNDAMLALEEALQVGIEWEEGTSSS
jgi:hypothetical protein